MGHLQTLSAPYGLSKEEVLLLLDEQIDIFVTTRERFRLSVNKFLNKVDASQTMKQLFVKHYVDKRLHNLDRSILILKTFRNIYAVSNL